MDLKPEGGVMEFISNVHDLLGVVFSALSLSGDL
jgi:hypothetical protein